MGGWGVWDQELLKLDFAEHLLGLGLGWQVKRIRRLHQRQPQQGGFGLGTGGGWDCYFVIVVVLALLWGLGLLSAGLGMGHCCLRSMAS